MYFYSSLLLLRLLPLSAQVLPFPLHLTDHLRLLQAQIKDHFLIKAFCDNHLFPLYLLLTYQPRQNEFLTPVRLCIIVSILMIIAVIFSYSYLFLSLFPAGLCAPLKLDLVLYEPSADTESLH